MGLFTTGIDPALLAFPFVMVVIGTVFQTATGAGLGLVASPALLLFFDAPTAVQVATVLNLLLSIFLLPFEWRQRDRRMIAVMTLLAALGLPFGLWILLSFPDPVLRLLCGGLICLSVLQLRLVGKSQVAPGGSHARMALPVGAVSAGLMTGALAIPGPAALWALLNSDLSAQAIRATLRFFFVAVYFLMFAAQMTVQGPAVSFADLTLALLPALGAGIAIGLIVRRRISDAILRTMLKYLLLLMGVAMLAGGLNLV